MKLDRMVNVIKEQERIISSKSQLLEENIDYEKFLELIKENKFINNNKFIELYDKLLEAGIIE